jgi:hypothetical protein
MLRISSETGGKLACRRDWLLQPHGCEARSAEQPADDHPQHCRGRAASTTCRFSGGAKRRPLQPVVELSRYAAEFFGPSLATGIEA